MYQSFRQIYDDVCACQKCALAKTRTNPVFGEGSGKSGIFFIGEGPGAREDETGRPFVGPAGQLLDRMLAAIDLKREDVFIANVVKCRPPHNADPKPEYAAACLPYLREQVRYLHPKILVLLGRIATQHILKQPVSISHVHGKLYQVKSFNIIPTYHPSALLRDASLKRAAWEDFKIIRDLHARLMDEQTVKGGNP